MKTPRRLNQNMTAFQVKRGRVLKKHRDIQEKRHIIVLLIQLDSVPLRPI